MVTDTRTLTMMQSAEKTQTKSQRPDFRLRIINCRVISAHRRTGTEKKKRSLAHSHTQQRTRDRMHVNVYCRLCARQRFNTQRCRNRDRNKKKSNFRCAWACARENCHRESEEVTGDAYAKTVICQQKWLYRFFCLFSIFLSLSLWGERQSRPHSFLIMRRGFREALSIRLKQSIGIRKMSSD